MAADLNRMSVLAYANGFTLWHYKAGASRLADVTKPSFFDPVSSVVSGGDMILVSAADGGKVLLVSSSAAEDVQVASLAN